MARASSQPQSSRPDGEARSRDRSAPSQPRHRSRSRAYRRQADRQSLGFVRGIVNAALGGAVIVGLLTALGVWRAGDRFLEGARMMLSPAPAEPEVDVRSVIVQQLRGASELTTAIFAMEAVVPAKSDRTLAGYVVGSTNLLYIAYGEVRAGVDLSEVTANSVQFDQNSARVVLPPPRILDSKLDLSRSNVYDYDRGFLGLGPDNAPNLQELAQQEALLKIVEAACTQGILAEANRRAELTVGQLLTTAGFATVDIQTQPPDERLCTHSAQGASPESSSPESLNPGSVNPGSLNPGGVNPADGLNPANSDTVN